MEKHYVQDLASAKVGSHVTVAGWLQARRKMGKVVFFDLRDSTGVVQLVCFLPDLSPEKQTLVNDLKPESVFTATGELKLRSPNQVNAEQFTGKIEIAVQDIALLSPSKTPPFEIDNEERQANEELRLQYRYLDLRHERMARNLRLRHRLCQYLRNYLTDRRFIEIQTPLLSKSTPEGARDYLVPSRLHRGKFFALPQSPQQYKQLLMVAGFERYFQIAPCFRDEDARADRSPGEFYQIDMEMSFMSQNEILEFVETMFTSLVAELCPEKKVTQTPWPRLSYAEAMKNYGNDKPDLRKDKNDPDELAFGWVIDFPLLVPQSDKDHFFGAGDKWAPSHHMFTAPHEDDIAMLDSEPGKVRGLQHDLVLNGFELGGGSIRIHDAAVQEKIFDLIGFTDADKDKFRHLLRAFTYGVPPHGGIAPGLDRLVMILAGEKNLHEVTAFPLTSDGRDPMMEAPSDVALEQLDVLGLQLKKKK